MGNLRLSTISSSSILLSRFYYCRFFFLVVLFAIKTSNAIQFRGHPDQFAAYESWDACSQARMSFDFRTRDQNALLVYTDDGKADYLMLTINDRQVTLQMRVAAKSDQSSSIAPQELTIVHPASVSNNAWQRLEIFRNRLEVSLRVGGQSVSRTLQAADLRFGSGSTPVYIGGVPRDTRTLTTSRAQQRYLTGDVMNLLFFAGCGDCNWRRARLRQSLSLNESATELCDRQPDICRNVRYLCKTKIGASSTDDFQCVPRAESCGDSKTTHYHLGMDSIEHESIVNIAGLDTRVYGAPSLQPGVLRRSLELDCSKQTLVVSGASHRQECFGDLSKCERGYTLALWIWFKDTVGSDGVYLTNGGHTAVSHGVALELVQHALQFTFRSPSGEVWKAQFRGVRPERWYHVAAVWNTRELTMYVDGKAVQDSVRRSFQPSEGPQRERDTTSLRYKHFYIGRNIEYHIGGAGTPPEGHPSEPKGLIRVDELHFWAETRSSDQIREQAICWFRLPLDRFTSANVLDSPDVRASLVGSPGGQLSASFSTDAKFGMSLSLPANSKQYISLQQTGDAMSCFTRLNSSVDACPYGIMASFWVQLNSKESAPIPLFQSGPFGLQVWLIGQRLRATANVQLANSPNSYEAYQVYTTSDMPLGHWCLVEVSFRKRDEKSQILSIIVNNGEISASISDRSIEQVDKLGPAKSEPHAFLAGGPQAAQSLNGLLDEVTLWTSSRETLLSIGFIQRKRPQHYDVSFDEIERDGSRGGGSTPIRIPHSQLAIGMVPGSDTELPIIKGRSRNAIRLRGQGALVDLGLHKTKCLGNLDYCHHGALVAFWIRIPDSKAQVAAPSCYLDTGLNGIRLIRERNKLRAEAATSTHLWSVDLDSKYFAENGDAPGLSSGWHFVELTWHLDRGLRVFVDNQLVARVPDANTTRQVGQIDSQRSSESLHRFYVGRCSTTASERGALVDMDVDELEYWYADREWLVAFDYILRGLPPFYVLDMDYTQRNGELRLVHPTLHVNLYGNPTHSPAGKVDWSIRLNGDKQWMEAVSSKKSCLGNLTLCRHGLFMSMLLNFDNDLDFDKPRYLLSTGPNDGLQFFQRDQKLYIIFNQRSGRSESAVASGSTGGKGIDSATSYKWEVEIPRELIRRDRWYFFEFSWHPEKGLDVFLNRKLIDHADKTESNSPAIDTESKFLIGQQNVGDSPGVLFDFAKANYDEMEIWFATRDYLLAHEYIIRDEFEWLSFPMEYYKDGTRTTIEHPIYDTYIFRSAELRKGYIQQSLYLDGHEAYAQIPIEANRCAVSVMRCRYGLMATFYLKPVELRNGTTFLSTRDYQLTYEGGKLVGRLRRPLPAGDEIWTVSTSDLHVNQWNLIDFSWHPLRGLSLHINNTEKDFVAEANKERQSTSIQAWQPSVSQSQGGVFLGRDLRDNNGKPFANAYFDEVQFWHAPRETLLTFDLIYRGPVEKEIFPFQEVTNDLVKHDRIYVYTLNGPQIVTRTDGQTALHLDGVSQGVRVGDNITCQYLDGCVNGYTIRMLIRPTRLYDGMYLLSSDTAEIFYRNGKIVAKMRSTGREWTVEGQGLRLNSWNWVDVSWYNETGLTLYINGRNVTRTFLPKPFDSKLVRDYSFYVGRPEQSSRGPWAKHAEMDVARVELWKARYEMIIHERGINTDLPHELVLAPLQPDGKWYIEYDLRHAPASYKRVNMRDIFDLRFQTSGTDGWLVQHAAPPVKPGDPSQPGHRRQGLWIGLQGGHLVVTGGPDKESPSFTFTSPRPINDNAVHSLQLEVERQPGVDASRLAITVDGEKVKQVDLPTSFHLISDLIYNLGGAPETEWRKDMTIRENFRGFINEAVIRGDQQPQALDLLELYYKTPRDHWVKEIHVKPAPTPPPFDPVPAITFVRPTTGVTADEDWPLGSQAAGSNSVQLTFSTLEHEALLLMAEPNNKANGNGVPGGVTSLPLGMQRPFIALEIFDAHLYFVWSGSGAKRLLLCPNISDGQPHIASIKLQHSRVSASCDSNKEMVVSVQAPFLRQTGDWRVSVGGTVDYDALPWLLYTHRASARGFVGCILSLSIDTLGIDFRTLITQHAANILEGCRAPKSGCSAARQCNTGRCFDSWAALPASEDSTKRFVCDCSATAFVGATCSDPAPIYTFNGSTSATFPYKPPMTTHRNDISFRVKTASLNGPLFYTETDVPGQLDDYISASLENGLLKVVFSADGYRSPKIVNIPRIADNRWHPVRIARRGKDTWLIVDGVEIRPDPIPAADNFYIDIDRVIIASPSPKDAGAENFVGQMQGFIIHPEGPTLQPAWNAFDGLRPSTDFVLYPISLLTPQSYLDIDAERIRDGSVYTFSFRTGDTNGLLAAIDLPNMPTALPRVELINGQLYVGAGIQKKPIPFPAGVASLADNNWHQVTLIFNVPAASALLTVVASVDDTEPVSLQYQGKSLLNLNIQSMFYLGGVPPEVKQRFDSGNKANLLPGISGCFATVFRNGRLFNLWQYLEQMSPPADQRGISKDCLAGTVCLPDSCKNGGICKTVGLTFTCDCSGTGREGETCANEPAIGYNFTNYPVGGILTFNIPDFLLNPAPSVDKLAFGFMTHHPQGVILRLTSSRKGEPVYIELQMKDRRPVAEVVIGNRPPIVLAGSTARNFDDGDYHGLLLIRDGKKLNLSADGLYPIGSADLSNEAALALSNALRHPPLILTLGARPPVGVDLLSAWPDEYWTHSFAGIVGGLYINGARPFASSAITGDAHGNVKVASTPFWIPQAGAFEDAVLWENGVAILTSQHAGGGGAGIQLGSAVAVAPIVAPVLTPAAIAGIVAAGVILGLLLLLSALLWAFYRCKPGWCPCFSSPSSAKVLTVTAPKPIANYQLVQAAFAKAVLETEILLPPPPPPPQPPSPPRVIETEVLLRSDNEAQTAPLVQPQPAAFGAYSAFTSTSHKREMVRETEQFLPPPAGYGTIASQFSGMPQYLSDEVRVDCFLFTTDGRYVVTGSSTGPPQVWDMQTGELLRTVSGLDTGSGDLHLCCDETMLAGHMALGANPPADIPPAYRKFELWDFASGRQLQTQPPVYYTASALLKNASSDGSDQVLLARTSSEGTAAVIWDVARNQQIKDMRTSWTVGDADSLVCALATPDNRYAVLGFLSPFTGNAHYLSFDLSRTFIEANSLEFDAYPECTVIISNVEAATGTRKGEIIIWDVQLARALRQLYQTADPTASVSGPAVGGASFAHLSAINSLAISQNDLRYLVSASSDCTLKIWDLATETCEHTLTGHTDEVWCTALASNDSLDLVASGSSDHTIRLWRRSTGKQLCWFNTHTDVFSIKISPDGRTVAALGDKFGTRKLILLQMVKHRQRKQTSSTPSGANASRTSERV